MSIDLSDKNIYTEIQRSDNPILPPLPPSPTEVLSSPITPIIEKSENNKKINNHYLLVRNILLAILLILIIYFIVYKYKKNN